MPHFIAKRLGLLLLGLLCLLPQAKAQTAAASEETRVVVESDGWQLVGDLRLPLSEERLPVVLMLNKAAGDRGVYNELAQHLAARGIASLRLDLRGHGESTNLRRFIPGEQPRSPLIWDAEADVAAVHAYMKAHPRLDPDRVGIVGSSYSGEEMAEAGRMYGYAQAYVTLSPGSFSEASIAGIDASGVAWLLIASKNDRYLQEITASVQAHSQTVSLVIVPGTSHASDILTAHPDMAERIAVWLQHHL